MKNLPLNLRDKIDALYISAYEALEKKDLNTAKEQAENAWELLPEPKFDWDVTLSFVSGICDMYKELGFYEKSHKIVDELLNSDHLDDYDDGPIFLKGAIYFEQGKLELAKEWFDKANTISKGRCFVSQPKKYKAFYSEY